MPRPYASGLVPAPADAVWAEVREFNGLPEWHPAIASSVISDGADNVVGAIRSLRFTDGNGVSERLVALDAADRSYTYEFTDPGPFAARSYRSTIRVAPVTATGESFVEWWAFFDADAGDEPELFATFRDGVYAAGIANLAARFSQ